MMRYIGSKSATLSWLTEAFAKNAPTARSLCDPFAGTCSVARHFKSRGFLVMTGDVLELSHVLQIATVACDVPPSFFKLFEDGQVGAGQLEPAAEVLAFLQNLPGVDGYIYEQFSPGGKAGRMFFTVENARHIDAISSEIRSWQAQGLLSATETAWLLAALIAAADRVANTAGTYYAYLKSFTRKAKRPLCLIAPPLTAAGSSGGCFKADALEVVSSVDADILYLDPPYNERDYAGYYHLPETLALGDNPEARGMSGAPQARIERSDFYRSTMAAGALSKICQSARAKHIVVHYTTEGTIGHHQIMDTLAGLGSVTFEDRAVRAYSARQNRAGREAWHRLYWCAVDEGRQRDGTA